MKRSVAPSVSIVLAAALVVVLVWLVTRSTEVSTETDIAEAGSDASVEKTQPDPSVPPPIENPDETSTPTRKVVEVAEVEREATSVMLADGQILVRGTLVVVDAQGVEHREEDGECRAVFWKGEFGEYGPTVPIVEGRFELVVDPAHRLSFSDLTAGDHITRLETDRPLVVEAACHVELRACWLGSSILRVIDGESGADLSDVTVVRCSDWEFSDHDHPGDYSEEDVLFEDAISPLTIIPEDCGLSRHQNDVDLWVRSRGFAWKSTEISFEESGERILPLVPEAELEVTLLDYHPPSPTPKPDREDRRGFFPVAERSVQRAPDLRPLLRVRELPEKPDFDLEEVLSTIESMPDDAFPGGVRPTAEELQANLPSNDEAPLDGRPRLERYPEPDQPTLVTGLSPGQVVVSVEVGRSWEDSRIVLGWKQVELEAGKRTAVTLELDELPDLGTPVPFEGTLYLSEAWGELDITLSLEPMDLPDTNWNDWIEIPLGAMKAVAERPGLRCWSAGEVLPGRYEALIREFEMRHVFHVDVGGLRDAHIEIGEPAEVVVHVLDAATGEPAEIEDLAWSFKRPVEVTGWSMNQAERDPDTASFRFQAPAGQVELSVTEDAYAYYGNVFELQAGANEITIILKKACGIVVTVREGDRPVPIEDIENHIKIMEVDGPGRDWGWSGGGQERRYRLSNPGLYEIRIEPIDGYEPVPPEFVQVPPDEFVDHVVVLKRTH